MHDFHVGMGAGDFENAYVTGWISYLIVINFIIVEVRDPPSYIRFCSLGRLNTLRHLRDFGCFRHFGCSQGGRGGVHIMIV